MFPNTKLISHRLFFVTLLLLTCLLLTASIHAQTNVTGAVEGQVTNEDRPGEPVPDAVIQLINQDTGVQVATKVDQKGYFIKYQLYPGTYLVIVRAKNFKEYRQIERVDITETRRVIPLPILLTPIKAEAMPTPTPSPGSTPTTEITPTPSPTPSPIRSGPFPEGGPDINTTDARRGGNFNDKEVSTLPLGATTLTRTYDELTLLLPGVTTPPQTLGSVAGPGIGAGVGSAGQFSVNGLRSRGNNFTVDGSDNNDEDIGVRRQGFLALVPQPVESIQEYQAITLLAPAQYGRNIGAQVNAVSKSGGNQTHGMFYGFFNSSQLNASNFFDKFSSNSTVPLQGLDPTTNTFKNVFIDGNQAFVTNNAGGKDSSTLFQTGLALGGPLIPSNTAKPGRSLFYFISAEGQFLHANQKANFAVPTVEERGAFMSGASGFTDIFGNTAFPTTLGGDSVFSLFPFPNNPNGIYGRNTFTESLPASGRGRIFSMKADGNFLLHGKQQNITSRFNLTDDARTIPVTGEALFSSLRPHVRTYNFSNYLNSEITSNFSNQVRASYGRTRLAFDAVNDNGGFLVPSRILPTVPFLLNAPVLSNATLPGANQVDYITDPLGTGPTTTEIGFPNNGAFGDQTNDFGALGPIGQVSIAGFSPLGVDVFNFPQSRVNNTYQLADTANLRRGNHQIAFGIDIRRTELNSDLPRNSRPLLAFNGAPVFLFDSNTQTFKFNGFLDPATLAASSAPTDFSQTLAIGSSAIDLRYYQYNFFGQDVWRVRRNLVFSYGLRYEYNTPPFETHQSIENTFNNSQLSLIPALGNFIAGRTRIFDPDHKDFAPRVAIAYSPHVFGDKTTVIRAGYGIFYDQILGAIVSQSRNVFPNFLTINTGGGLGGIPSRRVNGESLGLFNPALNFFNLPFGVRNFANGICLNGLINGVCTGVFEPYVVAGTLNQLNPNLDLNTLVDVLQREFSAGGFGFTLPARHLRMPMAQQYSVTVEQQLSKNMVISVAYVGTQGRHLLRLTTPNLGPNVLLFPTAFDASSGLPTLFGIPSQPGTTVTPGGNLIHGRPIPTVGSVNIYESSANSRYDALQVQLRGRFVRSLQFQANYTFSRANDDASDVFDLAGAPALPQNSLTRAGEYGPSNFDARHRIAYSMVYDLPSFNDRSRAFRAIFGDVELASTGQFQTGQPFTINSIFDVNGDGNLTDRPNTTNGIVQTNDRSRPYMLTADPASLLAPFGQDGSVGRNAFRGTNLLLINLAVIKTFRIKEQQSLIFRTEFFNITNRANFGIPVRYLEAPGFGESTDTITPGFRVQFALKYSF